MHIKISSPETKEFWEIPVLWEDDDLLAIDKPSRLHVTPAQHDPGRPDLMALLHRDVERQTPWAAERKLSYLAHTHSLDSEASGVLLLAKNKPALTSVAAQLGDEKPHLVCVALVQGCPPQKEFRVEKKIAPHPVTPGEMHVDAQRGKKAITDFEVIEVLRSHALIRCRPLTDRAHQIRVHLCSRGFPLAGDELYGGRPVLLSGLKPNYRFKTHRDELPLIGRAALHATEISLLHPTAQTPLRIESPWPKDLLVALKYLRRYAPGAAPPLPPTSAAEPS